MPLLVRRREVGSRPQQYAQPFRELQDLQEQTAQLLQQVMPGAVAAPVQPWIPDVDIEEAQDAWVVEAELPGARAEDVHVEVHNGELSIRGEIVEKERAGVLRRRTRRVGEFEYQVTLPEPVDSENPEARLHDGVLEVRVPKAARARSREIPIRSDGMASSSSPGSEASSSRASEGTSETSSPGR
jgi:HSP20 family protein